MLLVVAWRGPKHHIAFGPVGICVTGVIGGEATSLGIRHVLPLQPVHQLLEMDLAAL